MWVVGETFEFNRGAAPEVGHGGGGDRDMSWPEGSGGRSTEKIEGHVAVFEAGRVIDVDVANGQEASV